MDALGDKLNIFIDCNFVPHHNWMAYSLWYSINKNLPDAQVSILCNRELMSQNLFNWTRRCGVKFKITPTLSLEEKLSLIQVRPVLILEPDVIVLKEFEDELIEEFNNSGQITGKKFRFLGGKEVSERNRELVQEAKTEKLCTFISYEMGLGNFVASRWINTTGVPFDGVNRFRTESMTINERKGLDMWDSLKYSFRALTI